MAHAIERQELHRLIPRPHLLSQLCCRFERHNLVVASVNDEHRHVADLLGRVAVRSRRHRNGRREEVRVSAGHVPGAGSAHAEPRHQDLFPVDRVVREYPVEHGHYTLLAVLVRPALVGYVGSHDDGAPVLETGRCHAAEELHAVAGTWGAARVERQDQRHLRRLVVVTRYPEAVGDFTDALDVHHPIVQARAGWCLEQGTE